MKVLGIHSVEVLVEDVAAAAVTFRRLFNGARFEPDDDIEGLACLEDGEHGLTLLSPTEAGGKFAERLRAAGSGSVLTALFAVEDIEAARSHLQANDFPIRFEADYGGGEVGTHKIVGVDPKATHGFMVTFIERKGAPPCPKANRVMPDGVHVLGLNRAEIVVADPDAAEATFTRLFNGANFLRDNGVHNRPLDCRVDWDIGLELVHPKSGDDLVGRFLKDKGEGAVLTVVFDVASMDEARDFLAMTGFETPYEADYGASGPYSSHKQIVVNPEDTHGLRVTFMESKRA
jgi:hypothetical protein